MTTDLLHLQVEDLRVHDISTLARGEDPTRPVTAATDGTRVVLLLDAEHGEELAYLLGLGSARAETLALGSDTKLWDGVVDDLITATHHCTGTVAVPVLGIAR